MSLEDKIEELESYIPQAEARNPKVSKQSVGWQIHHSLKVIHSILLALEKSDPSRYKWTFSWTRAIFLRWGWFPRGKAKAPKISLPPEEIDLEGIKSELEAVRDSLSILEGRSKNSYFRHPYFGQLNMSKARKFLSDHTNHHLKIIRDILKNNPS